VKGWISKISVVTRKRNKVEHEIARTIEEGWMFFWKEEKKEFEPMRKRELAKEKKRNKE